MRDTAYYLSAVVGRDRDSLEVRTKIFSLAIHPYLSGQPHRIKYLEAIYDYTRKFDGVLYWNGEQILDWYLQCAK